MPKGGYKLIDLGGADLYATVVVPGVYESLESSNGKPTIVTNFVINSVEQKPAWVNFRPVTGGNYEGVILLTASGTGINKIRIDDTDQVSIVSVGAQSVQSIADAPSASM